MTVDGMFIKIKKKKLGLGSDDQTLTDMERANKLKKKVATPKEKSPVSRHATPKSTQMTLSELNREFNWKKSQRRASERKE